MFRIAAEHVLEPDDVRIGIRCLAAANAEADVGFGAIRMERMVGAFDCGKFRHWKQAESRWSGGKVMKPGRMLLKDGSDDERDGRVETPMLQPILFR